MRSAHACATIRVCLAPGRVFLASEGESMNETPLTTTEWPSPERLRRPREREAHQAVGRRLRDFEESNFGRKRRVLHKPAQPTHPHPAGGPSWKFAGGGDGSSSQRQGRGT